MTYRLVYTQVAKRQIIRLDGSIRKRIREGVERLAEHPELGKPLQGILKGRWSYRVGDYRILYRIERHQLIVLILTVGHRREIYD